MPDFLYTHVSNINLYYYYLFEPAIITVDGSNGLIVSEWSGCPHGKEL